MIACIPDLLNAEQLNTIRAELARAAYVDGATTAGWSARGVKKNQQVDPQSANFERLADTVRHALLGNGMLQAMLLPAAISQVMFNRYSGGMEYGPHVDAPVMGGVGNALRSDIAMTVFLDDPRSYEGGELVAHSSGGLACEFKLEAGHAVTYPANTLHQVKPVLTGARNAAVLWVQSLVRDPAKRELLWDLENAKRNIFEREGKSAAFDAVSRSRANLLRMWAEVV